MCVREEEQNIHDLKSLSLSLSVCVVCDVCVTKTTKKHDMKSHTVDVR